MRYHRKLELVKVAVLQTDARYQPEANRAWARTLAESWEEPDDPIHVSRREDGSLYTIDGQHRALAKVILEGPDARTEAFVYSGLSVRDEALLYLRLNRQKQKNALKKWQARLTGGDHTVAAIEEIFQSLGIRRAAGGRSGPGIRAVDACEDVYGSAGAQGLEQVLQLCRDAWALNYPKQAYRGVMLKGINRFLREQRVDLGRLLAVLRNSGPADLQAAAGFGSGSSLHTDSPGPIAQIIAERYERYVKQLKGRKAAQA